MDVEVEVDVESSATLSENRVAFAQVLGFFFYREAMDPLAGWVHHIAYLGFLSYLIHAGVSRMFVFFGVEEIPTRACPRMRKYFTMRMRERQRGTVGAIE